MARGACAKTTNYSFSTELENQTQINKGNDR
jgi:hypothetical protein